MVHEEPNVIDIESIKNHWIETSDDDFGTMNKLFKSHAYNWALFVGHISVEKLLKALYVELHEKHAPTIHNLCTREYTELWTVRIKELRKWIKKMF